MTAILNHGSVKLSLIFFFFSPLFTPLPVGSLSITDNRYAYGYYKLFSHRSLRW
jgi:hypothetical protein